MHFRLDILSSLYPIRDLRFSGHVIYTGRSSMEIVVKLEALEKNREEHTIMLGWLLLVFILLPPLTNLPGRFSMVCRDAITHKAHPIIPLAVSTPEEKALLSIGEGRWSVLRRKECS